jgi:alanine racemase
MAVLKADAYHAGAVPLAAELGGAGIDAFGVGDSTEALELRSAGVGGMILVLGAIIPGEVRCVLRSDVSVCIHSRNRLEILADEARRVGRRCRVHLKVDTGLGRLGVLPSKALDLARSIHRDPDLIFEGVATHLAGVSGEKDPLNDRQLELFAGIRESIRAEGLGDPLFHASASPGLYTARPAEFDMVRVGLLLHGVLPARHRLLGPLADLRPILALRSQVIYLKDVPAGSAIGYRRTFRTSRPTRIATIPVGYNDGLPLSLSNVGSVLVRGHPAPVVGAISMDYTTLDVGDIPGVEVGDRVTLIGTEGAGSISLNEMAEWAGTIAHALLCSLGNRVVREYHHPAGDVRRSAVASSSARI